MRKFLPVLLVVACKPGLTDYAKGNDRLKARDYAGARAHFDKAVAANPDFSEAWMCLGMSKVWLARLEAEANRDDAALALWREGRENLRKAKDLMERGTFAHLSEEGERQRTKDRVVQKLAEMDNPLFAAEKLLIVKIRAEPWPE